MPLDELLPHVARSASLTDTVYRTLRESIADGRLAAGSKITERELAAALGVSPTPVREALSKLQLEGLVERTGPRRMQIVDHPEETLHELMEVEVMLRVMEARFAARKIDDATITRMSTYIDELVAARDSLTLAEQYERALTFDAEIAAAAANPALRSLIESYAIFGADIRIARAAEDSKDPEWIPARIADHREIVAALKARDEEAVERIMRRHLGSSLRYRESPRLGADQRP
jgi:DNA-binding GntR family transcriptional regulator